MKITLSLIGFIITGSLFAQTKQMSKYDQTSYLTERYEVLMSDTNTRQGEYSLVGSKLLRKGFYKNNQKDSVWTSYNYQREPQIVYDYTNKKLIDYKQSHWDNSKDGKYYVINGSDTTKKELDQPPIYLDGDGKRLSIMIDKVRYPTEAREKNIRGKVLIAFTVDTNGGVSNYVIKKRIGGGCDEEALRVVQLINGEWVPGMLNGKPVKVEFEMPFSFALAQ
jgi:TonB family protein